MVTLVCTGSPALLGDEQELSWLNCTPIPAWYWSRFSVSLGEKARENLKAGQLLLDEGCVNAAASRLYYSLFQAGVHVLETKHGKKPGQLKLNATKWEHGIVCSNARLVRDNAKDRNLFEAFRGMREEADYLPLAVEPERVRQRIMLVRQLVEDVT